MLLKPIMPYASLPVTVERCAASPEGSGSFLSGASLGPGIGGDGKFIRDGPQGVSCNQRYCHNSEPLLVRQGIKTRKEQ